MAGRDILVIHPQDRTTKFLQRIKNCIHNNFGDRTHIFNIKFSDESHNHCLEIINSHPETGIIIFLGHGRTDSLAGSKADNYYNTDMVSQSAIEEHPQDFYGREIFIDEQNVDVFKNKKIFCLACNSNNKIGNLIIEAGATSFLGFGNIPTSLPEFAELKEKVNPQTISLIKAEVNYIIKNSLSICLQNDYSFQQLNNYIKLIASQRISSILRNEGKIKDKFILSDHLYFFKNESTVLGDRNAKLLR